MNVYTALATLDPLTLDTLLPHLSESEPQSSEAELIQRFLLSVVVSSIESLPGAISTDSVSKMRLVLIDFLYYINTTREFSLQQAHEVYHSRNMLQEACFKGYDRWCEYLLELLRHAGTSHPLTRAQRIYDKVPNKQVDIKYSPSVIEYLNRCDEKTGRVALHYAVIANQLPLVTKLLDCGVDIDVKNNRSETSFHQAIISKKRDIAELLKARGANIEIGDNFNKYPIYTALDSGDSKIMDLFLPLEPLKPNPSVTPLHYACKMKAPGRVEWLLEHQNDISGVDRQGDTALHVASRVWSPIYIQLLLKHGAQLDIRNKAGDLPFEIFLRQAAKQPEQAVTTVIRPLLELYLSKGADTQHLAPRDRDYFYRFYDQRPPRNADGPPNSAT